MSIQAAPQRMSYAQFLDWADERMLEWVDGQVVEMAPAATRHQRIAHFLTRLLGDFVELADLGEMLQAPFQMKLEKSGREPDLLFVADAHRHRLREVYLDGPADLVVEIVSPESKHRDRVVKRDEYEAGGVPEYWLVDAERLEMTLLLLDTGGRYREARPDEHGRLHSRALPGMWIDPNWLWQDPLPPALEILRELGVLD